VAWVPRHGESFISGELCGRTVRYEEIEHTADVGIRAYGRSLRELFANAAEGMFSLIADLSKVRPMGEMEVRVTGNDLQELLVNFLSELIALHETEGVLLCDFDVRVRGTTVRARVRGERIDKRRHELKLAIKAVTYHRLRIDPKEGIAEVIFDA